MGRVTFSTERLRREDPKFLGQQGHSKTPKGKEGKKSKQAIGLVPPWSRARESSQLCYGVNRVTASERALSFRCLVVCLFDIGACIHYVAQDDPDLAVLPLQPLHMEI